MAQAQAAIWLRLCERFAAPVIDAVTCQGGYLANSRLAKVHWQVCGRPLPALRVGVAGESVLWLDPSEVPAGGDIGGLGRSLAAGRHGERDELMDQTAACSGLRWGELTALTIPQIDQAARVITLDRKGGRGGWTISS